jgi:prepilin-type N-terminal cleavage/methylation domain-containing protein
MKPAKHNRGFSLIELLISIVIIGVLIALLAPALSSFREASRRAVLLSNLSSSVSVLQTYAHDQRDAFPCVGLPLTSYPYSAAGRQATLDRYFGMSYDWSLFIADGYLSGQILPAAVLDPRGGRLELSCTALAQPNYFDPYLWTGQAQLKGQRFADVTIPAKKTLVGTSNFGSVQPNVVVDPRAAGMSHPIGFVDGHAAEVLAADWLPGFNVGCSQLPAVGVHSVEWWPGAHTNQGIRGRDIR